MLLHIKSGSLGFSIELSAPFLMKVKGSDAWGVGTSLAAEKRPIMAKNPTMSYLDQRTELDKAVIGGARDPEAIRPYLQAIIDGSVLSQTVYKWAPVCTYLPKIAARNELRGWGLTDDQLLEWAKGLQDHDGFLRPEAITLSLGKGLQYDLAEAAAWATDVFAELGESFTDYVMKNNWSVKPYGGLTLPSRPTIAPAHLELLWDKKQGITADDVRTKRADLPILELYWLLCLNPHIWLAMDGKDVPYMRSPGVVVDDDDVLDFGRDGDEAYVYDDWSDDRCSITAFAAFRE